jgi:uncharacterized HAD superfamily protein
MEAAGDAANDIAAEDAKVTARDGFEEFLRAEYNNIAQAHFQTHTSITRFFEFYLIVVGLPITIAGVILKCVGDSLSNSASTSATAGAHALNGSQRILQIVNSQFGWFPLFLSAVIAIIGLCMMAYIVNLRLDALLYARAVNGIRRYFFDRVRMGAREQGAVRVLPRSIHQPRYREWPFFGWVIVAFTCLNSLYVVGGFLIVAVWLSLSVAGLWGGLGAACLISAVTHVVVYEWLIRYREWRYLRTRIIGVDIDGVLSDHEPKFCEILKRTSDKDLTPAQITKIPVHELDVGVMRDDEYRVFNDPEYWVSLNAIAGAVNRLNELRDVFGFQLYIFTHRDWPNLKTFPKDRAIRKDLKQRWRKTAWFATANFLGVNWLRRWAMRRITKRWLKSHRIVYDRLLVEHGNVHMTYPAGVTKNRFVIAQKKQIRIFVEDDLAKAAKLSGICDIVFLLAHGYNEADEGSLPANVIRLSSWDEIFRCIRDNL